MPSQILPDAALVVAARNGDAAAWRALVHRYDRLLRSVCHAHRLNPADAADVVQTTWLRTVEQLDRVQDPRCFAGWLATVARRECLRVLRHGARVRPCEDKVLLRRPDPAPGPDVRLIESERRTAVRGAVRALAPRDRTLVHLLFNEEEPSYAEIGRELGMPIGSIGPTRARALARLRQVEPIAELAAAA